MRSIVLSGFAGTGKTTVAPIVAAKLGVPWVDTDEALVERCGSSIADLWRAGGEARFRELEAELVEQLFSGDVARVLSFGGGTVTSRALRHLALDRSFLVTLTAAPAVLLPRLGDFSARPLLAAGDASQDRHARVARLLLDREGAYAECHLRLATDELSPGEVAEHIVKEAVRARVVVPLGVRSYAIEVVTDAPRALTEALTSLSPSSLVVVSDETVRGARGAALLLALQPLRALDAPIIDVTIPPGEKHKTLRSVEAIWSAAAGTVDRDAVVLGFGGGVVGDLAAFAASTLLRGIRVVQAPTTLLAMADSSVGGKTGFDVPAGKNLIGSFHQPSAVVADLGHLVTLEQRDYLSGLAEVVKVALACDALLFGELERSADRLVARDLTTLEPILRRAIELKARVVRDDETEAGMRRVLNLGHTIGHALEAATGYEELRHGEAVSIGLVAECLLAERLGHCPHGIARRVEELLTRLGLPTTLRAAELAEAWPWLVRDKKRAGRSLLLALPKSIGAATLCSLSLDVVAASLDVRRPG